MRYRGKDDGDDANDGGGSVADRGFMTRGLLAVPYSEAAISRGAQAGSPERKKNHPTGFRPQPSSSSAPGHGCEDYNGGGGVGIVLKTWTVVTLESHKKPKSLSNSLRTS